ncbi:rft protein [Hirsutella rhossiliensis]|uniref:Man(5)GlcNAc(2)-PP-dolichol translocation protein RFT1 n=1 Tax=Hirsutella rhossiliensis TaxID=111463 RepID=A0A9P8SMJ7_9HYPO|nr:rft protein [Hirsutella rhossiliensis]KAH0967399.1 rft protein [Hirsutella rhossiliensis]
MPSETPPSVVQGASLLILLQLLSRLVTFVANQLLVRLLTAPLLGLATQLDVYYLSVLFFARESLRVAIQRQGVAAHQKQEQKRRGQGKEAQAVVNLGYLALALGVPVAVALAWLYLASASPATLARPHLVVSLRLYALAALVELVAEPCFVLMQMRLRFATRAAAESLATLLRCLVVFGAVVTASRRGLDVGVLPFALGQLAYAYALLAIYLVAGLRLASDEGFSLVPKAVGTGADFCMTYFYRPTVSLAASMMAQSVVKHLLTQGDTFLVSLLASPQVQGVYALANNYGGLVARLLLQPVEESCRSYFSRLLSSSPATPADDATPSAAVLEARRSLTTLARLYLVLSAVVASVGPFAAPSLLALVAGSRWAGVGAGHVLATYCFYVPFLALNGLAESLVASVATERQVHRQSLWMAAFSVVFAAAAYLLMRVYQLGARGLVLANIVNMLCRIVWSAAFIKAFFTVYRAHFSVASLLPRSTLVVSLATFIVLRQLDVLDKAESEPVQTLAKVAGSAVPLLLMIVHFEKSLLLECFQSVRGRKGTKP